MPDGPVEAPCGAHEGESEERIRQHARSWNHGDGARLARFRHVHIKYGAQGERALCIKEGYVHNIATATKAAPKEYSCEGIFKTIIGAQGAKSVKHGFNLDPLNTPTLLLYLCGREMEKKKEEKIFCLSEWAREREREGGGGGG